MRIHILGIAGTAMASLAGLLVEAGHQVSGSDKEFYSPTREMLYKIPVKLFKGYSPYNLDRAIPLDAVVVGNVISAGNPELEEVLKRNLEIYSFPEALYHFIMKGRKRIVVAGTHGKTTTSAMLAYSMEELGLSPGYLVGGVLRDYQRSYRLGKAYFIVEGDEYESSFFDKGPKFAHYFPEIVILNAVEFDHADIFPDMESLLKAFSLLTKQLHSDGLLLSFDSDHNRKISLFARGKKLFFSYNDTSDIYAEKIKRGSPGYSFEVRIKGKLDGNYRLKLLEKVNILNSLPVIFILREFGFSQRIVAEVLAEFSGVKRRMDPVVVTEKLIFFSDFAHHPTAYRNNIQTLRENFPDRKLIVIVEPRTWSMRKKVFEKTLPDSLVEADVVIIAPVFAKEKLPPDERLNTAWVAYKLIEKGTKAYAEENWTGVIKRTKEHLSEKSLIVLFSNGEVSHYINNLVEALKISKIQ